MRKDGNEILLVVANFSDEVLNIDINIPAHAFEYLQMAEGKKEMIDLLTNESEVSDFRKDNVVGMSVGALNGRIYKL